MGESLATAVVDRIRAAFEAARDPDRAMPMAQYMRNKFAFLGISSQQRRQLAREALAGLPEPDEATPGEVALRCWELPEREYQYFACDYLRRHANRGSAELLTTTRRLLTSKAWWDTVDPLAAHVVGTLVRRHPVLVSTMDKWVADSDVWLVRTAILHQLRYREATDADRLFGYCTAQASHRNFFVQKAIGWALREYAKTAPDAVRRFVRAGDARLSPLSVREALKNMGTAGPRSRSDVEPEGA